MVKFLSLCAVAASVAGAMACEMKSEAPGRIVVYKFEGCDNVIKTEGSDDDEIKLEIVKFDCAARSGSSFTRDANNCFENACGKVCSDMPSNTTFEWSVESNITGPITLQSKLEMPCKATPVNGTYTCPGMTYTFPTTYTSNGVEVALPASNFEDGEVKSNWELTGPLFMDPTIEFGDKEDNDPTNSATSMFVSWTGIMATAFACLYH